MNSSQFYDSKVNDVYGKTNIFIIYIYIIIYALYIYVYIWKSEFYYVEGPNSSHGFSSEAVIYIHDQ